MKRIVIYILTLTVIFLFNSCESKSNPNLQEFLKIFNSYCENEIKPEIFITTKEENYVFSAVLDDNILLTLYADDKNEIIQCSVTTDSKSNKKYYNVLSDAIKTTTLATASKADELINTIKTQKEIEFDGWLLNKIESEIGTTVIINRENNDINTNTLPTLKEAIEKDNITRPTAAKDNNEANNISQ